MKVLAVDTTSDVLSLALADGKKVWHRRVAAKGRHEELLPKETEKLLKRAKWQLSDIELLVAASGPGSFTGIRIGMAFASVLAETLRRPAVAVSRFEAEAFRAFSEKDSNDFKLIGIALPSRPDEIFYQTFRLAGKSLKEHRPPQWVRFPEWPKVFRATSDGKRVLLAGPAAADAVLHLTSIKKNVEVRRGGPAGAEALISPALELWSRKASRDFAPMYLKPAYYERQRH